jgi:hypothetical protein
MLAACGILPTSPKNPGARQASRVGPHSSLKFVEGWNNGGGAPTRREIRKSADLKI